MRRKAVFYNLGNNYANNNHFLSDPAVTAGVGEALGSRPTNLRKRHVLMSERRSQVPLISNHVPGYPDFFSTLQASAERGHRCNRGTLACDDKRTPTASKKTYVLSAVEPERCETIIISISRTALHWRGSRALMAEGVRGAGRIRTEERNWDHFGRAVTQYNFIFLGLLASFCFFKY